VRGGEVVHAALEQRPQQPVLERDHLCAETERVEVVLPGVHADAAAAVRRVLPRVQPRLELDSIGA
jgi:hypothetical protein